MKRLIIFSVLIFFSCEKKNQKLEMSTLQKEQIILERVGEIYYKNNCLGCHPSKNVTDNFVKFAITGDKYGFEFLKSYITDQDSLLNIGDETAVRLKENYGNQEYLHHFKMNDKEIKSIIYYLKKIDGIKRR